VTAQGVLNGVTFIGIWVGMALGGADPAKQLSAYMAFAIGTLGLASALRHIVFAGSLGGEPGELGFANQKFFEWEAGFANLAFGVMALVTSLGNWGVPAMSAVAIGYAIYLLGASTTHLMAGWKIGSMRRSMIYASMTGLLIATGAFRVIPAWNF
jgi:hypothetical protein